MIALWFLCAAARADDTLDDFAPAPPGEDELPQALATRARIVPSSSFEFAFQYSWGDIASLDSGMWPGPGVGLRASWGKHLGLYRLGFAATTMLEGDLGKSSLHATEVVGAWDHVGTKGLLLGAGLGGTLVVAHVHDQPTGVYLAPTITARIGGSQTWSRYQRRLFAFFEAKVRFAGGEIVPMGAILFGAGKGAGEYQSR